MNKFSKEQWQELVKKNCLDSYSFAVQFAILNLWEAQVKTKEDASEELHKLELGLTGAQAEMAIGFVLRNKPDGWLDKEMVDISR